MPSATSPRLHRLIGTGFDETGGGLPLPLLFTAILNELQDHGPNTTEQLAAVGQKALSPKEARVREIYKQTPGDPWLLLAHDALEQLAERTIINRDVAGWSLGPGFRTNSSLVIIPPRKGKRTRDALTVTVWPAFERQQYATQEHLLAEVRSLVHALYETGLRPLNPERLEELGRSMDAFGYLAGFPILVDQFGRVLSGRHRLAAAKSRGIEAEVTRTTVVVSSDEEALAYVWLGNDIPAWSDADRRRLGRRLLVDGPLKSAEVFKLLSPEAKRDQIRFELRKNPGHSTRQVADILGCDYQTVAAVKAETQANGVPGKQRHQPTQTGRETSAREPSLMSRQSSRERVRVREERERRDERVLRRVEAGEAAAHAAVAEGYSSQRATEVLLRAKLVRAERALAAHTLNATTVVLAPAELEEAHSQRNE